MASRRSSARLNGWRAPRCAELRPKLPDAATQHPFRVAEHRWEARPSTKPCGVEVLVRDGVSPVVQLIETLQTVSISGVQLLHLGPEVDPKPFEVRAEVAGVGVSGEHHARGMALTIGHNS